MSDYRRYFVPGGSYFFTIVTYRRASFLCNPMAREILGAKIRECRSKWPFEINAILLMPDHLHTIWSLPPEDIAYPRRWGWIKKEFTSDWLASGASQQVVGAAKRRRRRRGVWQPRFWEHLLDDEDDFESHFDYIHYETKPRKVDLARKVIPHITRQSIASHLDLKERLTEVTQKIRAWNRLGEP